LQKETEEANKARKEAKKKKKKQCGTRLSFSRPGNEEKTDRDSHAYKVKQAGRKEDTHTIEGMQPHI